MNASALNGLGGLISRMGMAERIKEAMGERSPADIARATGKTAGAVSQWLDGTIKSLRADTAAQLERETGFRATWIVTGKGPKKADGVENTTLAPAGRRVPLISWVQAGMWGDVQDNFHPGEADEWAIAFDSLPGKSAFALRVDGDSMTSPYPGDLSFPDGTIVIVDPDRAGSAGSFVIAKDVNTQKATFKKLMTDSGRWYLKPLNPTYPTIEIDDPAMRVIGRVIEYQTRGKL